MLKGYESSLFYSIAIYLLLSSCQSQRILHFFRNYSYWFLSFSCPYRRNMTHEGFLCLVWALLFLKENFSFFLLISSSLHSKETRTKTKKKETLTGLVFLRSTTTVKNTLGGFLPLLEKGHRQSSHALCTDSACNWIPTATSEKIYSCSRNHIISLREKGSFGK